MSKALTLLITFQPWVLELWYFKCVFFVTRPLHGYQHIFTQWPWPLCLTYFLKTLTLLITFKQWVLELWYFTWVFLVTRTFCCLQHFWLCDLDLWVWPTFWKLYQKWMPVFIFYVNISCGKIFLLVLNLLSLTLDLFHEKINISHYKIIKIRAFYCTGSFFVTRSFYW